jgi:undecaprenyl diphosphate synthase
MTMVLALNYSSKWEILEATKKIALKVKDEGLDVNDIDECMFSDNLSTTGIPDPELLIRTSGECRLSNFLMWQLSYAELIFTQVLWPDYNKEEFYKAIINYQNRERRFGMTSEQLIK